MKPTRYVARVVTATRQNAPEAGAADKTFGFDSMFFDECARFSARRPIAGIARRKNFCDPRRSKSCRYRQKLRREGAASRPSLPSDTYSLWSVLWNANMSALGQKQTFAAHKLMSALPLKADMHARRIVGNYACGGGSADGGLLPFWPRPIVSAVSPAMLPSSML